MLSDICAAETLTLEQCLERAKTKSPTIRLADNAFRSADLAKREFKSTGFPQLKIAAGASFAPMTPHFGYDPAISNGGQIGAQVVAEQPLYDGGRRNLKTLMANIDLERLSIERKQAKRDLTFAVTQAFIAALQAQLEESLQQENLIQLIDYFELVKRLNAGGAVGYTDLLKTQADLSNAAVTAEQAAESSTLAKYALAELMGDPMDTAFVPRGTLEESASDSTAATDIDGAIDTAHVLDLAIANFSYKRSLAEIQDARREWYPAVSMVGDFGLLTSRENLQLQKPDRTSIVGYSIGVAFEMPLYDWGGRNLRIQERRLAGEAIKIQMDSQQRSLAAEYQKNKLQLTHARTRLIAIRKNIKVAEDNFLLTKSKYAAGALSATEVLSARQLLTETQLAEIRTMADMQLLSARIKQMTTM
jgi:outer membrane protein